MKPKRFQSADQPPRPEFTPFTFSSPDRENNSLSNPSSKKASKRKTRGSAVDLHPIEKVDPNRATPEQESEEEVDSEGGSLRENHPIITVYPKVFFYAKQAEQKALDEACQPLTTIYPKEKIIYPSQDGACELAINEHYSKVVDDSSQDEINKLSKDSPCHLYPKEDLSFRIHLSKKDKEGFEPTRKDDQPFSTENPNAFSDFSFHQVSNDEIVQDIFYDDFQVTNEQETEETVRYICGPTSNKEPFWHFLEDTDTHSQSTRWLSSDARRSDSIRLKWYHKPEPEPKTGTQASTCKKSNPGKLKKLWRSLSCKDSAVILIR